MFKNLKLKTKIIWSVIFSAIILSILISLSIYFYLNKKLVDDKLVNIEKLNIEQVHESIQIFKNNETFTKMLGSRTRVKEYLQNPTEAKKIELLSIFSDYAKEDSKYLSLYLLDKSGTAVISTDPSFVGNDYSFRDYYKEGMEGKTSVDLLLGKTTNKFGYYYSYPVVDNGITIGVFVAKIDSGEVDNAILDSEIAKESSVMLVDRYGVIITSNKEGRFLDSIGELNKEEKDALSKSMKFLGQEIVALQYDEVQDSIRNGDISKTIELKDEEDEETEVLSINKIGEYPFYIVSETGLEKTNLIIFNIIFVLMILIIVAVILTATLLYKLILVAISPLKKLRYFAQNISNGDFSGRIDIKTKDDFGELSEAFNKMTDNLEDLYKNLDNKVREKTEEVEKSKDQLKKTLSESERINKLMVGRELEMIKLKKEIVDLKNK
jgi:C4-dicarboxylate-specific signal transduction histidine kinase